MSAQSAKKDDMTPVILLNGLPVKTTYMANCRLCLGTNFGEQSTTIVEERFSFMLTHVFSFPIPNHIGLPMNVCSKCRRGVELFYKYTNKVQTNQKKLQDTFIPVDLSSYQLTIDNVSAAQDRGAQHPTTNRGQEISNVVEIDSDDELQNDKDDTRIEIDLQCEPVTDNGENYDDPLVQPSSYEEPQTHFVAVPGPAEVFRCTETNDFERNKKRDTRAVAKAPVTIEIISLSDDECEENAQAEGRLGDRKGKRKKDTIQNRQSLVNPQSSGRTSSRAKPAATMVNNVIDMDNSIDNFAGGVTMVYYEADGVEETDGAITSSAVDKCTKSAPSSKRTLRSTIIEPIAKRRSKRT